MKTTGFKAGFFMAFALGIFPLRNYLVAESVLGGHEEAKAHWVRIDLVDGAVMEGAVVHGLLYERPSSSGFVACRESDDESGIRLWYCKGTLPWRFIPSMRIKNVFTLKSFDQEEYQALSAKWEAAKSANIKQSDADASKARSELLMREKEYFELIKRRDPPPVTEDAVKDTGHVIKGATLAVTLDSTGHNTVMVDDPSALSDPDLTAYFLGYRPDDKGRLMGLKNSTGSLALLSPKDRQFLALYDRWFKLYGASAKSTSPTK